MSTEIEKQSICQLTPGDACLRMESSAKGLTQEEAEKRLAQYGKNQLREKRGKPMYLILLSHFGSMMAILLWVGGIVAIVAQMPELGIAIWLVNIINGTFSFVQERKAGKATEALKNMLPSYVRVIRGEEERQILAEDLVPGDIMILEEGDKISADARLLASNDFQVNQSTLTGESNPVRKNHDPFIKAECTEAEMANMVFAGTSVSGGTARAVVTETGMNTQFGRIADLTQNIAEEKSPLQKELDKLTKQVSIIATGIGIAFFIATVFLTDKPVDQAFIFALGMIVAFIPEGLLPTVTLALAMAVQRMAKKHALVKKLSAVETLGCTTVICSDKTGTLTQNEMTVCKLWMPAGEMEVTGQGYAPVGEITYNGKPVTVKGNTDLKLLLRASSLCCNARVVPPEAEGGNYTVLGDPTEACLGVVAQKGGLSVENELAFTPRIRELPFDSNRKRMTTVHQAMTPIEDCDRIAYIKGAPSEMLDLCTYVQINGQKQPMTAEMREEIKRQNDVFAKNGLRVLAVAYRLISTRNDELPKALRLYTSELIERDMIFIGLTAMQDPPRPEVFEAVKECRRASIRIIMITGDYGLTAESIAKKIGIVQEENPRVISGLELLHMQDDELKEALKDEVIFARVAPEQKFRIVSCLQEMGNVVAVTGDGVNDAPALKKADIGVAMGITGTDVAKESADMILTDDNFASIVNAIEEGRAVYSNLRKFLLYILNSNMPEAVPSAAFLFSRGAIPLPLTVMEILSIDLGTDMAPALGLGTELPEPGVMDRPPRSRSDKLLNVKLIVKAFFWYGLIASAVSMGAYFLVNLLNGWPENPLAAGGPVYAQATTMTFAAIVFCQIGAVLNCRTERKSVFSIGLFSNKRILYGIVIELLLVVCLSYIPLLQQMFGTGPLALKDWLILMVIPIPVLLIEEARKCFIRWKSSRKGEKA